MKVAKIALVLALTLFVVACSSNNQVSSAFVNCLEEKDVKFYGAYWCPHCSDQKEMFGDQKQALLDNVYVECDPKGDDAKPGECKDNNIQGFPTWIIDGEKYPGVQSLDRISSLSGCSLSEEGR